MHCSYLYCNSCSSFPNPMQRTIRICQNVTCKQQGAEAVLGAFKQHALSGVSIEPSGCLGQCGNGPMAVVLPEEVWYCHLYPSDIPVIVKQHLLGGKTVCEKLYPRFHHPQGPYPAHKSFGMWLIALCISLCLIALLTWTILTTSVQP